MPEVEHVKPRAAFVEEAIAAAIENRWGDALAINRQLIERHGADEETHNRIGKAQSELGHLTEALEAYRASLELNPLNLIAQKQVRRINALLEAEQRPSATGGVIDVDLFNEDPGKSGLTVLMLPTGGVSVEVSPGDAVELVPNGRQLLAETAGGIALGTVEPKLAHRLTPLIQSGNRYSAAVARAEDSCIEIAIREVYQSPANARRSSFPVSRSPRRDEFRPYAKESLLAARGIDDETLDDLDDDGRAERAAAASEEDLMGMQELNDEFETAATGAADEDASDDEDGRPEDSY